MKKVLLILLLISVSTFAQKRKYLYGKVLDSITTVKNAHVLNLQTNKATFTDFKGNFKIFAKIDDSLKITSIQYETKIYRVTKVSFGFNDVQIFLKRKIYQLDEVELKSTELLGFIDIDSKNIKTEEKIDAKTLKLPFAGSRILSPAERRLHSASTNIISIHALLNWISGRTKKLKYLKFLEDKEKRIKNINSKYHFFIKEKFKILDEDITRFIYYYEEDKEFESSLLKNKLDMISFLNKKAISFKKLNQKKYN